MSTMNDLIRAKAAGRAGHVVTSGPERPLAPPAATVDEGGRPGLVARALIARPSPFANRHPMDRWISEQAGERKRRSAAERGHLAR